MEKFRQLSETGKLILVLRVVPTRDDVDLTKLRIRLVGEEYSRDIPVSPGGRLEVPFDPEALKQHAEFLFNVPSGTLKPEVNVLIRLEHTEMRYRELMDAMQQADRAERALMTFAQRMIYPKGNAVAMGFGAGSAVTATIASTVQGDIVIRTNRKGILGVVRDEQLLSENPVVRLSAMPDWALVTTATETAK